MKILVCTLAWFAALAASIPTSATNGKRVVCYIGSWAVYRQGGAKMTADDVDCSICTHFIYSFVGLDETSGLIKHIDAEQDRTLLPALRQKCQAGGTKFMVAIGGWGEGSTKYSQVMADAGKRAALRQSIIDFVQENNLDGFDLDWEYPGQRGGAPNDKDNFATFLDELYPMFVEKGWELSAAVSANPNDIENSYHVKHLSEHLSFINVMTYDLHGSWENTAEHHTGLYKSPTDAVNMNVDRSIRKWLELGATPDKLNLGLATYGKSMNLLNPSQHQMGAPTGGEAPKGWIGEAGLIGYNEICLNEKSEWTTVWDDTQKVPHAHSGNKWVAYDNPQSITIKSCYANDMQLGGIMYWAVDTDDFKGHCNLGKYPLIEAGKKGLSGACDASQAQAPMPPQQNQNFYPQPPQQMYAGDSTGSKCEYEGQLKKDPSSCSKFFQCVNSPNGLSKRSASCPGGTVFDTSINGCNYPNGSNC